MQMKKKTRMKCLQKSSKKTVAQKRGPTQNMKAMKENYTFIVIESKTCKRLNSNWMRIIYS